MDQYMNTRIATERLVREWDTHKSLIIAYDFDNTVYDYHKEDADYTQVTELLRECKSLGAYLIVFTASNEERYPFIIEYLKNNNIPYDSINEDAPFVPVKEGRKLYYNILLDDRAGLLSAYTTLKEAVNIIKQRE